MTQTFTGGGSPNVSALPEARLTARVEHREWFLASTFIDGLVPAARLLADASDTTLVVVAPEDGVAVDADRSALSAGVMLLLRHAFTLTRPHTTVTLRVDAGDERVRFEVEDECGPLPEVDVDALIREVQQRSAEQMDASDLAGSGRTTDTDDGRIYGRNRPQHAGCVFTVDVRRLPTRAVAAE